MSAHRTMSDETDLWLEVQQARNLTGRSCSITVAKGRDDSDVPKCELTDAEIDWLWPRYQRCSFPPASFAKRFAGTPRDRLTPRGKNAVVKLAYRFRRQIFGKGSAKWNAAVFIEAVRAHARAHAP